MMNVLLIDSLILSFKIKLSIKRTFMYTEATEKPKSLHSIQYVVYYSPKGACPECLGVNQRMVDLANDACTRSHSVHIDTCRTKHLLR